MAIVLSDDRDVENLLHKLYKLVTENGGWLHPKVRIVFENGDFRICSDLQSNGTEDLFRIPDTCLPRLNDFEISVSGDALIVEGEVAQESETTLHRRLLEVLIEIYNRSGKVRAHRRESPWFALARAPEILQRLCIGRGKTHRVMVLKRHFESSAMDRLLLETFFGTREFTIREPARREISRVLLPLVDCLNHHWRSPGFEFGQPSGKDVNVLSVRDSKPVAGSDECFVCYSKCDALDSYLLFNFVDQEVPLVRSIPLQVAIPTIGTMDIFSQNVSAYTGTLPGDFEEIRAYIPEYLGRTPQGFAVSHLLVPGENAPTALRRTAEFIIRRLCEGLSEDAVIERVLLIERSVIRKNLAYYRELEAMVEAADRNIVADQVCETVRQLAETQLRKLRTYEEMVCNEI